MLASIVISTSAAGWIPGHVSSVKYDRPRLACLALFDLGTLEIELQNTPMGRGNERQCGGGGLRVNFLEIDNTGPPNPAEARAVDWLAPGKYHESH